MSITNKINNGEFELYLHPRQKEDYISGANLYQHLKDENLLDGCATLEDLEGIQEEGLEFFREHFGDNFVYAWRSVLPSDGDPRVPCLCEGVGGIELRWVWLGHGWRGGDPALRFTSKSDSSIHVFSRNKTLTPSDSLSLHAAIELCQKNGLIVSKPLN